MQRWKLTIEYDGTPFAGWQRQDFGVVTVQQTLEEAIEKFTHQKDVRLHTAGRTDAGVHAVGQVAHVDIEKDFTPKEMRDATNYHAGDLPVAVLHAEKVPDDFEARYDARKRSYRYRITDTQMTPPTLDAMRSWHVKRELDLDAMRAAAAHLLGHHDFSSFRASECQANHAMRTIDKIDIWTFEDPLRPGRQICIDVEALSFLHHMVRNIAGTLKYVGEGKFTPEDVKNILEACDRTKAGITAPAHGLYFMKVEY